MDRSDNPTGGKASHAIYHFFFRHPQPRPARNARVVPLPGTRPAATGGGPGLSHPPGPFRSPVLTSRDVRAPGFLCHIIPPGSPGSCRPLQVFTGPVIPYARARQPPQASRYSHTPHFPFKESKSRSFFSTGELNQMSLKSVLRMFPRVTGQIRTRGHVSGRIDPTIAQPGNAPAAPFFQVISLC